MKKLVPLLALAVTACTPATLDRDLKDIPGLTFNAPHEGSGDEIVLLTYEGSMGSSCYRIPADTTLTANGVAIPLEKRGESYETSSGYFGCEFPRFKSPRRVSEEPLTEYVLSDGKSTLRATFKQFHAERSVRVKVGGIEETELRNGSTIDIEWLPASDKLEGAQVSFLAEGGAEEDAYIAAGLRLDANHIRFIMDSPRTGNFTMRITGRGQATLEACEGFTSCRADFVDGFQLPMTIE